MIVNIHAAKTQLSKLLERAEADEEIIIARAGRPVARLSPLSPVLAGPEPKASPFGMGSLRGRVWMAPDIDEDWADVIRQMEEGPIFPPDPQTR
jgi:prevent-host-death family protein